MSVENDLYADLRATIRRVVPEVAASPTGIKESDHIDRIAWEKLSPPYAVIHIPEFPESDEYSVDTTCYEPVADIFLVLEVKGPLNTLRDNLSALRVDFLTNDLQHAQVLSAGGMEFGEMLPPNQVFASKKMTHQAGKISVKCLIGESY